MKIATLNKLFSLNYHARSIRKLFPYFTLKYNKSRNFEQFQYN